MGSFAQLLPGVLVGVAVASRLLPPPGPPALCAIGTQIILNAITIMDRDTKSLFHLSKG